MPSGAVRCCDGVNTLDTCTGRELCDNLFFHCLKKVAQNTDCIQDGVLRSDAPSDADNISRPGETFTVPGAWEVSAQVHSLSVVKICVCFQGIQFFTEVRDDDNPPGPGSMDELVDSFSIDLTTSFLIPGANLPDTGPRRSTCGHVQFASL